MPRIVEALEGLAGERVAQQMERLAHNALRGEVWDEAVVYLRQAGEKALARSAYHEAAEYFERAIRALGHLPEHRETREQAIDLRLALGSALFPSGDFGRDLGTLRESEALAAALDDRDKSPSFCQAITTPWARMTRLSPLPGAPSRSPQLAGSSSCRRRRTSAMDQAITVGSVDFQTLSSLSLGETQMPAGRLEEAQVVADRALAHARAHKERGNQAYALHLLGDIATHCDPPAVEEADTHYREAIALVNELGMRPPQADCHLGLGTAYAKTGRREQARTELSTAITLYSAMDMTFWLP